MKNWRAEHPGYSRRRSANTAALGEKHRDLAAVLAEFALRDSCPALQDSWPPQLVAIVGIIARLRGDALQDTIARDLREIMVAGHAILHALPTVSPDQGR